MTHKRTPKKIDSIQVGVRLNRDLYKAAERLAAVQRDKVATFVRKLIEREVEQQRAA